MPSMTPDTTHQQLTPERLIFIANTIRASRRDTIKTVFNPGKGDDPWSLGCVGYKRACFSIEQLPVVHGPPAEWVKVVDPPLKFVFSIGGVPVRFFRGDPKNKQAPENQVIRSAGEIAAQFAFDLNDKRKGDSLIHRLVVKYAKASHLVDKVWLAEFDTAGYLVGDAWQIPDIAMTIADISPIGSAEPRVVLPQADVNLVTDTIAEEEEEVRKEGL